MKSKLVLECRVDDFVNYDWLFAPETETEDVFPVREDAEKAAKLFKVPQVFLETVDNAMREMADELIKAFKEDLKDLYKMVEDCDERN